VITLYGFGQTRSARVRFVLAELGLPYDNIDGQHLLGSPEVTAINPLGKVPAVRVDGRPLYESAAICNWLADAHPQAGLIPASGTWSRALHDQWTAFTLAELEAHIWSSARNTFVYPEDQRVPEIFEQNAREAKRGLKVFDDHLADHSWLVDDRFSVADIFAGYAIFWAHALGLTEETPNVVRFVGDLKARPHCPYGPSSPVE
jgi:glutathione S-transferase